MMRGKRESSWLVIRRCLAIIRCAQRGPATREDLLRAIRRVEDPGGHLQPNDEESLALRLEKDLQRIRDRLLVDLYYDRQQGGYVIRDTWMPLLDLPDDDLATIAWLEQTFDPGAPKHDQVHALLHRLRFYLDPERVREIEQYRTALDVDLTKRDEDHIPSRVWEGLRTAYVRGRRLEFLYLSPRYEQGEPRRHLVEPYEPYYFDTTRGHYYLRAHCRLTEGPGGIERPHAYRTYRLGRILELTVLPEKLPPVAPAPRTLAVKYELAPQIARLGVTRHPEIEVHKIERRPDGGAMVRGETHSVFWAVQTLLHYGPNCRVLGGPEVLQEMRRVVKEMGDMYKD